MRRARLLLPLAALVASAFIQPALGAPSTTVSVQSFSDVVIAEQEAAADSGLVIPPYVGCNGCWGPRLDLLPVRTTSPLGSGDLDGDGQADVVQVNDSAGAVGLVARRGADGKLLWSWSRAGVVGFTPMRVGTPSRPGVLVVWVSPVSASAAGVTVDTVDYLHVSGLDGATGKQLWDWKHLLDPTTAELAGVYPALVLRGPSQGAGRLLISVERQPLVVSAANGSANRIGPATLQAFSWLRVGDVDGDGYDDVGLTTGVRTTKVEAMQSTSGARLWQRAAPPGFPESFPHTGADSRRDDLVWTNYKTVTEGDEVIIVGCTATYVSGRDGKTRWSGVCPAGAAGDADGDGIQNYWIYACGTSGGLAVRSGRTGAQLWQWCPASNEYVGGPVNSGPIWQDEHGGIPPSDVQGDGVPDFRVDVCRQPNTCWTNHYVISGRDGTAHDGVALGCCALGASVDAHGDDYVDVTDPVALGQGKADLLMTARDGVTRNQLWQWQRGQLDPREVFAMHAADLNGDSHAEVVCVSDTWSRSGKRTWEADVIDGATGVLRWKATATY